MGDYSVQWRAVAIIGPNLHNITNINHQRVNAGLNEVPAIAMQHLETGLHILQEHSECAGITPINSAGLGPRPCKGC